MGWISRMFSDAPVQGNLLRKADSGCLMMGCGSVWTMSTTMILKVLPVFKKNVEACFQKKALNVP